MQLADRNDQIVEEAAIPRGDGALVALQRDLILRPRATIFHSLAVISVCSPMLMPVVRLLTAGM